MAAWPGGAASSLRCFSPVFLFSYVFVSLFLLLLLSSFLLLLSVFLLFSSFSLFLCFLFFFPPLFFFFFFFSALFFFLSFFLLPYFFYSFSSFSLVPAVSSLPCIYRQNRGEKETYYPCLVNGAGVGWPGRPLFSRPSTTLGTPLLPFLQHMESFGQVRVLGRRLFGSSGEEKAVRNRGTKLSSSPIFCAYKGKKERL